MERFWSTFNLSAWSLVKSRCGSLPPFVYAKTCSIKEGTRLNVIFTFPVPVIFELFKSKLPPNCGVVSFTKSVSVALARGNVNIVYILG